MTVDQDTTPRARTEPTRRPEGRPRLRWGGVFTTVCAVVALLASTVGLFWDFLPQFRPDPLDTVGADVAVIAVRPGVRLVDWLRLAHGADVSREADAIFGRRPSLSELRQPGEMIYVRTQVDGHQHKNVSLQYALYDGATDTPVPLPLPPDLEKVQHVRLDAPSQRSVQMLWTPDLSDEEGAYLRVELRSEHGLLAIADSAALHKGRLRHHGAAG